MSRPLAVLRPQPGTEATARAIEAQGYRAIRLPLFEVVPLAWEIPSPADFDALILTSANTLRHGGPGLAALSVLPVHAVGTATARAATAAGFTVAATGTAGAEALIDEARRHGVSRALHLGGRDAVVTAGGIIAATRTVYASEAIAIDGAQVRTLSGSVALAHSPRAAARLGELVDRTRLARSALRLAVISAAAAGAAGSGWDALAVADIPSDSALIATALRLAD